jgi:aspartate carbamoyltransferase regulatory subunit
MYQFDIDFNILGVIDPDITVNIIKDGVRVAKEKPQLPEEITNVVKCKNPRCITTTEQEIPHIFRLTDKKNGIYRCIYCESKPN